MTNIFSGFFAYGDWGLVAIRIAVGTIFLAHGTMKRGMWKMQPSPQMSAGMISTMRFLSVVEPLGGIAVLAGFLTQWAAIGLGIIMIGAIKMKVLKWNAPFAATDKNGWELDLLILTACIMLLVAGAGSLSLDRVLFGW